MTSHSHKVGHPADTQIIPHDPNKEYGKHYGKLHTRVKLVLYPSDKWHCECHYPDGDIEVIDYFKLARHIKHELWEKYTQEERDALWYKGSTSIDVAHRPHRKGHPHEECNRFPRIITHPDDDGTKEALYKIWKRENDSSL